MCQFLAFFIQQNFFLIFALWTHIRGGSTFLHVQNVTVDIQQKMIKTFDRMWKYQQEESALGNHVGNGGAQSTAGESALLWS